MKSGKLLLLSILTSASLLTWAVEVKEDKNSYTQYTHKIAVIEDNILDQGLKFYIPKEFNEHKTDNELLSLSEKLNKSYNNSMLKLQELGRKLGHISNDIHRSQKLSQDQVERLSIAHVKGTNLLLRTFKKEIVDNYHNYTKQLERKTNIEELYSKLALMKQGNQCFIPDLKKQTDKLTFTFNDSEKIEISSAKEIKVMPISNQETESDLKLKMTFDLKNTQFIMAQDKSGTPKQLVLKNHLTGQKQILNCIQTARYPASI